MTPFKNHFFKATNALNQNIRLGLPQWLSAKESTCQHRKHWFNPRSRKSPHVAEQLSLCAATTEPVPQRPGNTSPGPACCN